MQAEICECGQKKVLDEGQYVVLGITKKVYCKGECEEKVIEFLKARDEIHDKVQEKWNRDMAKLNKKYPDFEMPDIWTLNS